MVRKGNYFKQFIALFPELELPVTLNNEIHHTFSKQNKTIPQDIVNRMIVSLGDHDVDEYTEYIACFKIPEIHEFEAVVFWRASLLSYTYYLTTYSKKGELIDCKPIAGLEVVEGKQVLQRVATIEDDWTIQIVEGIAQVDSANYDPKSTQVIDMELLSEGEIIFSLHEDLN